MSEISLALNDLFSKGRHSDVVELCSKYSVDSFNNPYAAHILSASLFNLGRHADAQNLLISLEPSFANNSDFLSLFAANSRRLGDLSKAKSLFIEALRIDPENLLIKNNYANLLVDQESYVEAKHIFESILQRKPDYIDAKNNLARLNKILAALSAVQEEPPVKPPSESHFSRVFQDPLLMAFNQDEISFSHNRYLAKFKDDKSKQKFQDLPHTSSSSILLDQLETIRHSLESKNPSLALKLCSKVAPELPDNASVYEYASDAYLMLKKFHESEICLLRSIVLGGSSLKHFFNMITFSRMRKDYGQAYLYFKKACNVDPSSPNLVQIKSLLDKESKGPSIAIFPEDWKIAD